MLKGIQQGIEEGIKKGIEEGELSKAYQVIKKGYEKGLSLEVLSELTGLAKDKIEQMLEQNKAMDDSI